MKCFETLSMAKAFNTGAAMVKRGCAAAALGILLTAFAPAPFSLANPDPHIPDGSADWCPAGKYRKPISGAWTWCLGAPYPDGTFYAQFSHAGPSGPFGSSGWSSPGCHQWVHDTVVGAFSNTGACGGGPAEIYS